MTSHTRRVLELGVGLGLALTLVLTALADWHQRTAARVRADTIRLHILANSDTWDDQLLKLQVRDAVLAAIPEAVTRADTPQQAAAALQTALPALQNAADNALHRAHSAQPARLRLERFAFAARDYGGFALPGGEYTALRIELGTAQGRNWFCVLYPSLCISGSTAAYPGADENALVFGRFEVRLAVADFIGRLASPAGACPLTDEGRPCRCRPQMGRCGTRAPHPALRATFSQGRRLSERTPPC